MHQKKTSKITISSWLKESTSLLSKANIATARLDCLVLLEDETGKNRAQLLAHDDELLDEAVTTKLNSQIKRRASHEPLSYIRELVEFYGRQFYVDNRVLVPRSESETMIDQLLQLKTSPNETIIDVGTGSGALAITTKLERPEWIVVAVDNDSRCLNIAERNSKHHSAEVLTYQGDLLEDGRKYNPTIIMANLPYVPDSHTINQAAMIEPPQAIFGGKDGLDLYRRMFKQLEAINSCRYVLTESLPFQHQDLASIAGQYDWKQHLEDDFIQIFARY